MHEFIDSTKTAHPDLRHRMILHNVDLGPTLAAMKFGNAAIEVARQHAREDLGGDVPLSWWVSQCRDLPKAREPVETTRVLLLERGWPPYGVNLILEVLSLGERFAGPQNCPTPSF